MSTSHEICVCRCCVDPRENGLLAQHGLSFGAKVYNPRRKGAFLPLPGDGTSISEAMLTELGKEPLFFVQGHRDCAGVDILYGASDPNKKFSEVTDTEKEFMRSHGDAAKIVRQIAKDLTVAQQIKILEEICPLASVNHALRYPALQARDKLVFYALMSETPTHADAFTPGSPSMVKPEDIGLRIYSTEESAFGQPSAAIGNKGIRICDFMAGTNIDFDKEYGFSITKPVDLEAATRAAVRWTIANSAPVFSNPDERLMQPNKIHAAGHCL